MGDTKSRVSARENGTDGEAWGNFLGKGNKKMRMVMMMCRGKGGVACFEDETIPDGFSRRLWRRDYYSFHSLPLFFDLIFVFIVGDRLG